MNYSNKLNLVFFLKGLSAYKYVIIKSNDIFPDYYPKADVDIFALNIRKLSREILGIGKHFLTKNSFFEVNELSPEHVHIDYMYDNEIDFRFDIYGGMPSYTNINIKKYFFYSILDRKEETVIKSSDDKQCSIYVPEEVDDLLIRYFEYLEYYNNRPEKIKHLDYVYDKLMKMDEYKIESFFNRLHIYTELPNNDTAIQKSYFVNKYFSSMKFYYSKLKRAGLRGIIRKVRNRKFI